MPEAGRDLLRRTEIALWAGAGLCFLACMPTLVQSSWAGAVAQREFPAGRPKVVTSAVAPQSKAHDAGALLGRLEIPALGLVVPISSGVDAMSLTRGVGHITGTALPGGLGTVGLAGHRDTYLRALRRVSPGMDIKLIDATGVYHYTVEHMEVVSPDQVSVLYIDTRPKLALITCYPFDYIGSAPRRFVVHASLKSVTPDA